MDGCCISVSIHAGMHFLAQGRRRRAQKRVRILPRPEREREREKEMREREREEGRDRREIGTKGERERERERRKDCYQSLLLYDGGARAEGEREGDEPAFSWADSRRLRLKPIKWRVERERKKEGTLTGSC